jgi:broad specificity phosphatase PhoE
MELRPGLEEIHYGKWEDKTAEFVKEHYWDDYLHWLAEPAWNPPTGGETSVEIASRIPGDRGDSAKVYDGECPGGLSQSNNPNCSL